MSDISSVSSIRARALFTTSILKREDVEAIAVSHANRHDLPARIIMRLSEK
jgi:hypothetical protein